MKELSRRAFLIRGSVGAAAVAVGSAMPNLSGLLTTTADEAPAADDTAAAALAEAPTSTEPLIAHVTDLQSGEMSVYMGEREFTFNDPSLARRLFGATQVGAIRAPSSRPLASAHPRRCGGGQRTQPWAGRPRPRRDRRCPDRPDPRRLGGGRDRDPAGRPRPGWAHMSRSGRVRPIHRRSRRCSGGSPRAPTSSVSARTAPGVRSSRSR